MHSIFWYVYVQPLHKIILCMSVFVIVWILAGAFNKTKKIWFIFNLIVFVGSFFTIVYVTLLKRHVEVNELILIPFHSFIEAKTEPELYRSMLMNTLLFFPLGLSMPWLLIRRYNKKICVITTVMMGMTLSIIIEVLQLCFHLGRCEVDDVIMNTLGCAIGAMSVVIANCINKRKTKRNEDL